MYKKTTQQRIKVVVFIATVLFFQHYLDQAAWHLGNMKDVAVYYQGMSEA